MNVNFDLLISGCNTRCRHCYVNGGPERNMPTKDVLLCIRKLDEIAAHLPFPASFTLDNEPFNHPDIASIIRAASCVSHIEHFHHGMTTGIALMQRQDKESAVSAYLECGCSDFGVTLHGNAEHHDEIVRRKDAFQASVKAAEYLKSCGASINVSLMFNRHFPTDATEIDAVLHRLQPDFVYFAVPNYTPHSRMIEYESFRASLDDLAAVLPYLDKWIQDTAGIMYRASQSTPGAVIKQLESGLNYQELFRQEQNELYLSVHQSCMLYMGNTGAETALLGDLRTLDASQLADALRHSPGNRDYGAFYDTDCLPEKNALIRALKQLPPDRMYADPPSVIYRGLKELQIPTKIIPI